MRLWRLVDSRLSDLTFPYVVVILPRCAPRALLSVVSRIAGGYPSGQRGLTVNQLRYASEVQILPRPYGWKSPIADWFHLLQFGVLPS